MFTLGDSTISHSNSNSNITLEALQSHLLEKGVMKEWKGCRFRGRKATAETCKNTRYFKGDPQMSSISEYLLRGSGAELFYKKQITGFKRGG